MHTLTHTSHPAEKFTEGGRRLAAGRVIAAHDMDAVVQAHHVLVRADGLR